MARRTRAERVCALAALVALAVLLATGGSDSPAAVRCWLAFIATMGAGLVLRSRHPR